MVKGKWICSSYTAQDICPIFRKKIKFQKKIVKAELYISALGVYEAFINDERVSNYVLAPGWTAYQKRIQYQIYNITDMLNGDDTLDIYLGKGWYSSPMPGWFESKEKTQRKERHTGIIASVCLTYEDGNSTYIGTDDSWLWSESEIRFSEIYDGETYDATVKRQWKNALEFDGPDDCLILQEGEEICEIERVAAQKILTTSRGEVLVDFGQEITGYVEFSVNGRAGEEVVIRHGEVLDADGNFYNDNYRSAKAQIKYICKDGNQTWHPHLTFFGFRYLKLEKFPGTPTVEQFHGVVVCSNMRATGKLSCSVPELNKLFSNVVWGQKGNFLDVPTDCPQRDERLGWTGDAQIFVKAAGYFFDVEKFFSKWMKDVSAEQRQDGSISAVVPDYLPDAESGAGWGDVAVIVPWQIYQTYGNRKILAEQFDSMKKWIDYITNSTTTPNLWLGGVHFGDWLGLDAKPGSFKGATRDDFVASAYYAYSTKLFIKVGKVLDMNMSDYERLYKNIVLEFRKQYPIYKTQTEHILAIHFGLAVDCQKTADDLADLIIKDGMQFKTGFIGTPYLLHTLSDYGYKDIAYSLLLRKQYPSWLYSIEKGATTIWEHWDGIMENGEFWDDTMNSFNHYAYGAVTDWVFEKAAGIQVIEELPGFEKVKIQPVTDERLGWLEANVDTRHGKISVKWQYEGEKIRYDINVEMPAVVNIDDMEKEIAPGKYTIWGNQ